MGNKMVDGISVALDEEDLKQIAIDKIAWEIEVEKWNHYTLKRQIAYREKSDPFLLSALSQKFFDNDESEMSKLLEIRLKIKEENPKV